MSHFETSTSRPYKKKNPAYYFERSLFVSEIWIKVLKYASWPSDDVISQEPITRSLQLLHIPVTAFSQTELFLV